MRIRRFLVTDMPKFAELVSKEWDLGKSRSKSIGNICGWIYMLGILSNHTEMFALEENGKVYGFAGYGLYGRPKSTVNKAAELLQSILLVSPFVRNRQALSDYENIYSHVTPEALQVPENADLAVLIVDKNTRGCGYGESLFNFVKEKCKENNCDSLLIETDEACSIDFYERQGCNLVQSISIKDNKGEPNSKFAFLYKIALTGIQR